MARIRTIKPDFWTDEKVVALSPFARLLFIGLWNFVDDEGRCEFSPTRVKLQILPADDVSISALLDEIRRENLVTTYSVENKEYLQVCGFSKHQKVDKRQTSKLPPPPAAAESPRLPPNPPDGMEGNGMEDTYIDARGRTGERAAFEKFMDAYPEPTGRKRAWTAWVAARRETPAETIMEGLAHYVRGKPPDRSWMSPATFLEHERWTDRYAEPPADRPSRPGWRSQSGVDAIGEAMARRLDQPHAHGGHDPVSEARPFTDGRAEEDAPGSGIVIDLKPVAQGR